MDKGLPELLEVMTEQLKVFGLLREMAESKTPALIKGDFAELERIVRSEELLVLEMGSLEKQRQHWVRELAGAAGEPVEEMDLNRLLDLFPDPDGELDALKQRMLKVVTELGQLNQRNNELLQQSLQHLEEVIKVITLNQGVSVYDKSGGDRIIDPRQAARILDRRA